eukprot:TRINITY_DN9048_c0_g1_i1.p1 TRINITY_DN9048_c0_g1~~TRINITY_DN9048_c0_g1_i1.p1  ORF type:complete len:179 (+),score=29.63 TRINITY_DN9048_c0_g1_i1:60-596(+)
MVEGDIMELEAVEVTVEECVSAEELGVKQEPFNVWNGVIWGSSGLVCTVGGSMMFAVSDRSGCNWWWALVLTPPLFFAIGILFQFFVVEKRTHPLCCCLFPPSHFRRTGVLFIAIEFLALLISATYIIHDMQGACESATTLEWIVCGFIGCVLLLSIFKDVFAVLPPPKQYTHLGSPR